MARLKYWMVVSHGRTKIVELLHCSGKDARITAHRCAGRIIVELSKDSYDVYLNAIGQGIYNI